MDWSGCNSVEREPARMSGAWVVAVSRVLADSVIENARAGFSAEAIAAEIFPSLTPDVVQSVIDFANQHDKFAEKLLALTGSVSRNLDLEF